MIGFREPGYLWKINDLPFVWGPIGNMSSLHIEHLGDCSRMVKAKAYLKNIISSYQRSHGRVKKALLRADYIFTALDDTQHIITKNFPVSHIETLPEAGIYSHGEYEREFHTSEGLRLLWVGRFIPTKKLDIALKVLSKLPQEISLDIVGWGNEQEEVFYKKYAEKLGVGERVKWHGKLPNADVQQLMRENDVFLFTSVVEGTPHVVLEAVSNNLPVVCFDLCGQGVIVNDEVGIKIPFTDNNTAIEAMVQRILEINCNREYLTKFSRGCKIRKTELSWESKINHVIKVYQNLKYGSCTE